MLDMQFSRAQFLDKCNGFLVPRQGHGQRLTPMPRYLELLIEVWTLEYAPARLVQCLKSHSRRRFEMGQVTVGTINVAERRRLKNNELQPRRSNPASSAFGHLMR